MPLPPKILVVADPAQQRELVETLRAAGDPLGEAVIVVGDGDDDTLRQFAAVRPMVVVIAATLEGGDARALVAAMREQALAAGVPIFVVLLGDERGPVRNALDALEFGCDRFVGRPVAAKALRFAVMSGLATAAATGVPPSRAPTVPGMMSARPVMLGGGGGNGAAAAVADTVAVDAAAAPVAAADGGETVPIRVEDIPTRPVSALRARWEALADAIGTGDGLGEDEEEEKLEQEREEEKEEEKEEE
ncbi:MAG TPA: hypothetical protein VM734_31455, partial [Kofleriaceae bacterium]|nr:hypothetical protein [Kofleriaceae bacterium]